MSTCRSGFETTCTTEYSADEILAFLSHEGIINTEDVEEAMKQSKKNSIIHEKHKYKIYQSTDRRWNTYIPDSESKYGRKRIVKATREKLEDFLYTFYSSQDETEKTRNMTLRQLYPDWLKFKELHTEAETYIIRINYDWMRFYAKSDIVDIPIRKLDKLTLDEWAHKLVKSLHLTKKRYYNMAIIMRQVLDYAVDKHIVEKNPFLNVKMEKRLFASDEKKNAETEVFTVEEAELMKEVAWNDFFHGKNHPCQPLVPLAVLFFFQTGLRLGEICSLTYSDISADGNDIVISSMFRRKTNTVIPHTKGTFGERSIPLTDEAKTIISLTKEKKLELNNSTEYIFSCTNNPIGYETLEKIVAKYCMMISTYRKSPHKIRKTWISTLLDEGINPDTVRKYAGHKKIKTTLDNYYYDRHSSDENRAKMNHALSSI